MCPAGADSRKPPRERATARWLRSAGKAAPCNARDLATQTEPPQVRRSLGVRTSTNGASSRTILVEHDQLPAAAITGVAHEAGPALARFLISDDNEHHTPGDLLQRLFQGAQAPRCTTVKRPPSNCCYLGILAADRCIWVRIRRPRFWLTRPKLTQPMARYDEGPPAQGRRRPRSSASCSCSVSMKGRPLRDGDRGFPPAIRGRQADASMKGRPLRDGDAEGRDRPGLRRRASMKGRPLRDGDRGFPPAIRGRQADASMKGRPLRDGDSTGLPASARSPPSLDEGPPAQGRRPDGLELCVPAQPRPR